MGELGIGGPVKAVKCAEFMIVIWRWNARLESYAKGGNGSLLIFWEMRPPTATPPKISPTPPPLSLNTRFRVAPSSILYSKNFVLANYQISHNINLAFTLEPPITHKLNFRKDESLLVRRDTFLILYACLEIVNGIKYRAHYCYSLPSESLYSD